MKPAVMKPVAMGLFLSLFCSVPVLADDTEIYTQPPGGTVKPNILFVLDNSGSMANLVPRNSSDPWLKQPFVVTNTYSGGCFDATKVYYSVNGIQPVCGSTEYFDRTDLHCDHANDEYDSAGNQINNNGPLDKWGTYADQMSQHSATNVWGKIKTNTGAVECAQDQGIHGSNASPTSKRYITSTAAGWQSAATTPPVWAGGKNTYTLYHGNYLNYLVDSTVPLRTTRPTRFQEVNNAINALVDTNTGINIGLLTFDADYSSPYRTGLARVDGGGVVYPVEDINTGRTGFKAALASLVPISGTPLSETYHEALRYFGGLPVGYGAVSVPASVAASQDGGGNYLSPITNECQKNTIIVLTDGQSTEDTLLPWELNLLPGFVDSTACAADASTDVRSTSLCLDDLALWAKTNDVIADDGTPEHFGPQTITTHTVGFAEPALSAPGSLIVATAAAGGGQFVAADNADSLRREVNKFFAEALDVSTTFSSPAVTVNAFNRSTHLDDLFFTLFLPGDNNHWDGNFKKYKLAFEPDPADATKRIPFIADATGAHAIDDATPTSSGFFDKLAKSFWSLLVDGDRVEEGGVASLLDTSRKVYTFTGTYTDTDGVFVPSNKSLSATANEVKLSNASLTDNLLGITARAPYPPVAPTPYRDTLINWAGGLDALDENESGTFNDARLQMGDPLHAQPALVEHGTATSSNLVAYVATNDGYLHAFDTSTGLELFSFIPQELLSESSRCNGKCGWQ